jgi:GntR family transcriptional regulator
VVKRSRHFLGWEAHVSNATVTLPKHLGAGALDRSRGPAHAQIADHLAEAIAVGDLAPGDRLPSEPELAARFGVSRGTLRQAIAALERRGLVHRAVGRNGGTFVAEPKLERDVTRFVGLSEQLRRQGFAAGARVLAALEAPASRAVAAALEVEPGTSVYELERVRSADGEPVALERTFVPTAAYPGLLDVPLDGSIYDLLHQRYGTAPTRAVERLEPTLASAGDAETLGVAVGEPLMAVERVAYGEDGTPLEFSRELYRGDRTRVIVWISDLPPPSRHT